MTRSVSFLLTWINLKFLLFKAHLSLSPACGFKQFESNLGGTCWELMVVLPDISANWVQGAGEQASGSGNSLAAQRVNSHQRHKWHNGIFLGNPKVLKETRLDRKKYPKTTNLPLFGTFTLPSNLFYIHLWCEHVVKCCSLAKLCFGVLFRTLGKRNGLHSISIKVGRRLPQNSFSEALC